MRLKNAGVLNRLFMFSLSKQKPFKTLLNLKSSVLTEAFNGPRVLMNSNWQISDFLPLIFAPTLH